MDQQDIFRAHTHIERKKLQSIAYPEEKSETVLFCALYNMVFSQ